MAKILVVDDEENIRKVLKGLLKKNGFIDIEEAPDGEAALEIINDGGVDLVISDLSMPGMNGMELFEKVKNEPLTFIILTAYGTVEKAVDAIKKGVHDFISKPFDEEELVNIVFKALKDKGMRSLEIEGPEIADVFFDSDNNEILKIKENLARVAKTGANILIHGETGTGKGLLAGVIHASSGKNEPFIKINCAAIPENLIEAELFGYKKGAFTGAVIDKPGKFELADGGTIFLDEIGELSYDMQAKLLCAIQDKEITPLGGNSPVKTDARIIAATNINIQEAIAVKRFREDLYFRLNVVEFALPPLRGRRADIAAFMEYFNEKYSKEYKTGKKDFDSSAVEFLSSCRWPGNIRQLENVVQKALIMEKDRLIGAAQLSSYVKPDTGGCGSVKEGLLGAAKDEKAKKEMLMIKEALAASGGNRTKAAETLGVSRRTLLYRIKEYGLAEEV